MPQDQRQTVSPVPSAHQRALIPSSVMDFPLQRLVAMAILLVLQAIKVFYGFRIITAVSPELYEGTCRWCSLLDAMFIAALYIFRIPWLQFTLLKSLVLIACSIWINGMIFGLICGKPELLLGGAFFKLYFETSLGQQLGVSRAELVNVKDVILDSSRILGKHTLHILPYGTAKLNPNDEYYCLQSHEIGKVDVYIPIVLNNTAPKTVWLSRFDFDSQTSHSEKHSGGGIQRATEIGQGKQGLEYYYIRINKPGVYKLDEITSKDGTNVRLYAGQAFVFTCPTARLQGSGASDYCQNDNGAMQLEVTGVPPLTVEYTRRVGDTVNALKLDHIQPPSFETPLARLASGLKDADSGFFTPSQHSDYNWASLQHHSIQMDMTFDFTHDYEYQLNQVTDGAGNVVDLSGTPKQVFKIHSPPSIQFACDDKEPIKLLLGEDSVGIPLHLKGSGPYSVSYEYAKDGAVDKRAETKHLTIKGDGSAMLDVYAPGEYRILSVSDHFCKGDVLFPSTCHVMQPPLPSVKLQSTSIPSDCSSGSDIGMRFVAEFQGSPPYSLSYSVIKKDGRHKQVVERQISTDHSRHIFTYLPTSSGKYTYQFNTLTDIHYSQDPNIASITQVVHPQPDAYFEEKSTTKRTCLGEEMNLSVRLVGTAPFTLVWVYDKQLYSIMVPSEYYSITLPPLELAGRHIVSLIKIEDSNGCSKDLDSRDVVVDVLRDRPMAMFYTDDNQDKTVYIAEDESTKLPLRLTGEGPWDVTYRYVDKKNTDRTETMTFTDPNPELQVNKVGRYELIKVVDSICKGDALRPDYIVEWMERPALTLAQDQVNLVSDHLYERSAVCQHVDDTIDVNFTGQGPFTCAYDTFRKPLDGGGVFGRRDGVKLEQQELTTGLTKTRVPLRTDVPGKYRYVFNKLSDQGYQHFFTPSPLIQLEQKVYASPTVHFAESSTLAQKMCVGDAFNEEPIWVEATGQAPFTVSVRVRQQDTSTFFMMGNIDSTRFALDISGTMELSGQYHVELLRIEDANGCASDVGGLPGTVMVIDALEIATITPLNACGDICVGDQLEYSLSGVGPFTIGYEFDGRQETVRSTSNKLSMIADKPGYLTILSVGNQRNTCQSFPKQLSSEIHPLPSSLVSGGGEIIENVQQGDMVQAVVDLAGTPPFDFEWKRSELIWDTAKKHHRKGRILESHVVHGVDDYQYRINTSVEGIIEVVSIKDRYCQYPRI